MSTDFIRQHCRKGLAQYEYGTAGFRGDGKTLDAAVVACAIMAGRRSLSDDPFYDDSRIAKTPEAVGIMITASHNPPRDNGVKLSAPSGSMLEASWESPLANLANDIANVIQGSGECKWTPCSEPVVILLGRDTRESSPRLAELVRDTIRFFYPRGTCIDLGEVTTPQLHFLTWGRNYDASQYIDVESYHSHFGKAYSDLDELCFDKIKNVTVDCANGVGAPQLAQISKKINLEIKIVNGNTTNSQLLNFDCGADYVKTQQRLPNAMKLNEGDLGISFDGDADRIVFYYISKGNFKLLDGDKIAALLAVSFKSLLKDAKIDDLQLGVVQTAYANGSSTQFLNDEKCQVTCTKTGVKHLHHEALSYDIGIYFEANGHGTILFSPKFHERLQRNQSKAGQALKAISKLVNHTVGDAIADMLAVIAVLQLRQLTPEKWDSLYTDLPNRLAKAQVQNRSDFIATDQERRLLRPVGLQDRIDELVKRCSKGRAFVRASGTEDAVRIYAEASTRQMADSLAADVTALLEPY